MFGKKRIYLDFASATPTDPRVARAVFNAMRETYGNPSAAHAEGRRAYDLLEQSREAVARSFAIKPEELVFTSGGTEANNLAIRGLVEGLRTRGARYAELHIVTSSIEHSSVLETLHLLEKEGVVVTYVSPDKDGIVRPQRISEALKPNTALVTLAHVNSEIGTIQPIAEIATALASHESVLSRFAPETSFPVLHADAAQSPLYCEASPHILRASLVSYDAQKLMGPKGVGVLYRDFSIPLSPLYGGGSQERGIRPGTENAPTIAGAALAFALAKEGRKARAIQVSAVRDYLVELVEKKVPSAELMGSSVHRIANNAHFVIPGIDGDYLAVLMDKEGIAVSPRSACIGVGAGASRVVLSITGDEQKAKSTIRFSLGPFTTKSDVEKATDALTRSLAVGVQ